MFKKFLLISLFIAILAVFSFSVVWAQNLTISPESIQSFNARIKVNIDNSVDITENIIYFTGMGDRHGIYRDIYPYSSEGREMDISVTSVVDENNNTYQYKVLNSGKNIRVKIGDPDTTFNGLKNYIISYHATNAVAHPEGVDEIYWNVTGNEWNIPIYSAKASVVLPDGAMMSQSACYFGTNGSKNKCSDASYLDGAYQFSSPSSLNTGEGLTVAIGFPKGVVAPYLGSEGMPSFWSKYGGWIVGGLMPLLTLIFSLIYWYRNGRDPKGTGVIIAQYDVPNGLTPMEVSGIVNEKVDVKQLGAEIIYLATKGYLKITQSENTVFGFIKDKDYIFTQLKDYSDLSDSDRRVMQAIFASGSNIGGNVSLDSLKATLYVDAPDIKTSFLGDLLTKGYYKNLGRMKNKAGIMATFIFMSIWASMFFGGLISSFVSSTSIFPITAGIFISIIIYAIIFHFSPAKTEKGVAMKEYLLGLKEYLQIAEKDRLQFHNAPEKNPEIFEKLLPYAMILGVVDIWAREFEGVYTTPPSWYVGPMGSNFNAIVFASNMTNFNSFAGSSFAPASSGSGGGGFSGGGGGGGGGGGW